MDLWLEYSKDLPSPLPFRRWTAIHAIGACAERRVWTQFGRLRLFPNLFVFLVGPPGVGKTVSLYPMSELLRKAGSVILAPNDITKQSLLDALHEAARGGVHTLPSGRQVPFDFHFLALHVAELSNFMSKYDLDLAGILTELYDCPESNEEKKRTHDKGKFIPFPGMSMIVGTATTNLGNTIGEAMWGQGFMARVIMVFSADRIVPVDMFEDPPMNDGVKEELITGLRRLGDRVGPMHWTPEARLLLQACREDFTGGPLHNRLSHYNTRRWMHLAKLCMIAALADERMEVDTPDFNLAMEWLMDAERDMPEIFKDMVSHADGAIHEELRYQMFALHMKTNRPIHASVVYKFLSAKVPSYSIERIIEVAIAADYLRRVAGTSGDDAEYIPQSPRGSGPLGAI